VARPHPGFRRWSRRRGSTVGSKGWFTAAAVRNSAGVRSPSELCGLEIGLPNAYSFIRASATSRKTSTYRHSSPKRPLKLSKNPFSTGLPGSNELKLHAILVKPDFHYFADEFAAVLSDRFGWSLTSAFGKPKSTSNDPTEGSA